MQTTPTPRRPPQAPPAPRPASSGFISGPMIAAPVVALVVYLLLALEPRMFYALPDSSVLKGKQLIANVNYIVIYAHLFLVFFRSHANPQIFRLYKLRFTVVPLALFGAIFVSSWALAAVTILAVWWDVYHSSMQTFGIGRIYDKLKGNPPLTGRRLDMMLNLLLYAGPVLGGVVLVEHLALHQNATATFPTFEQFLFAWTPAQHYLTYALLAGGVHFCIYYCYAYWRFARQGYHVSYQKVALVVILAIVSLLSWGFDSFGGAFFIMNFFHALQYFFLVWFVEKRRMTSLFRLSRVPQGQTIALALFIFIGVGYGVWSQTQGSFHFPKHTMICVLLVISILHFWYDGFIWSVRKGQV
jgi:hypothetical protein